MVRFYHIPNEEPEARIPSRAQAPTEDGVSGNDTRGLYVRRVSEARVVRMTIVQESAGWTQERRHGHEAYRGW